jgi:hypothetical protein
MKKIYFLLLTLSIFSCKQPEVKQVEDSRPKNEILLINKFKIADSIYRRQNNDIRRSEVSDSAMNNISNYIIKDLNLKAEGWFAKVNKITMNEFPKSVDVEFRIPLQNDPEDENPQFSSLILVANIDYKSKKLVDVLKGLSAGSKVLLTGKFNKVANGSIFITSYSISLGEDFSNPQLTFEVTDLIKK